MTTKTGAAPASPAGERAESFKEEVRNLKIKDPNAGRDALLLRVGAAAMVAGLVVTIVSYFMSHNTSNTLDQNDALTIGLIGISLTVLGGAVFLRYSFSGFLRFWLARFLVEQQQNRD